MKAAVLGAEKLKQYLAEREGKTRVTLTQTIGRLTLKLLRRVKADKLTGQVLNVRSGRLRRSINQRIEGANSAQVAGLVGTNVSYGRTHELGYQGDVREHLRLVKKAWGKELSTPVWARVPKHTVNYPQRSFLRSAITEMEPEILADVRNATTELIK